MKKYDEIELIQAIETLISPGEIFEVRALEVPSANGHTKTLTGLFEFNGSNSRLIADEIARIPACKGIYMTLNPVDPAKRSPTNAMGIASNGSCVGDADIFSRKWSLIDIDPTRPSNTSASEDQVNLAKEKAYSIRSFLQDYYEWPEPVIHCSGNGYHLLYAIDLPANDGNIIQKVLEKLSLYFDSPEVKIDQKVFNSSRIVRLPGTLAAKGTEHPDQGVIHRMATRIEVPKKIEIVPVEKLEQVASMPETCDQQKTLSDIEGFCQQQGIKPPPLFSEKVYGKVARIDCIWDPAHTKGAYMIQFPNGQILVKCHHDGCRGKQISHKKPTPLQIREKKLPSPHRNMAPEIIWDFCHDSSERMSSAIEPHLMALLSCLSGVLGNKIALMPKAKDNGWIIAPPLWGAIISPPGSKKSAILSNVLQFITPIEEAYRKDYESRLATHALSIKRAKSSLKSSGKTSKNNDENLKIEEELLHLESNPPILKRLVIHDTTIEKVQELLVHNPPGLSFIKDELSGLFDSQKKQGHETDRAFLLEAWNGFNTYSIARIVRGTLDIKKTCLNVFGTIQPDVLASIIRDMLAKNGSDGMISRFQAILFPAESGDFQYVDREPNKVLHDQIQNLFEFVAQWNPESDPHVEFYRYNNKGFALYFSEKAQELFVKWYSNLQNRLRQEHFESNLFLEHMSKFDSLFGKICLIFHFVEHAASGSIPPQIDVITAARAAAWTELLEAHARNLYNLVKPDSCTEVKLALRILDRIKSQHISDGMTINEILRKDWSGLKKQDDVAQGIVHLQHNGWLQLVDSPPGKAGGRPTQKIKLHPEALSLLEDKDNVIVEVEASPCDTHWLDHLNALLDSPKEYPVIDWMQILSILDEIDDECLFEDDYCF